MPVVGSADQKSLVAEEIYLVDYTFRTTTKGYHQRMDGWQEVHPQGNARRKLQQLLPMPRTIRSRVHKF